MDIKYYVGVKFENSSKAYYFGTDIDGLKVGDFVIADSIRGVQVGKIATESFDIKNYKSELPLKPIVRKASEDDLFKWPDDISPDDYVINEMSKDDYSDGDGEESEDD